MVCIQLKKMVVFVSVVVMSSGVLLAQDPGDAETLREHFEVIVSGMSGDDMEKLHEDLLKQVRETMKNANSRLSVTQGLSASEDDAALGIQTVKAQPAELAGLGMRRGVGLRLRTVLPDGPAAKAGFASGDIIESVQGQWIFNKQQLEALIRSFEPGDQVRVRGIRNGSPFERQATLARGKDIPGYKRLAFDSDSHFDFKFDSDSSSDSKTDSAFDSDSSSSSSSSSDSDSDSKTDSDFDSDSSTSTSSSSSSERDSSSSSSSDRDSSSSSSSGSQAKP